MGENMLVSEDGVEGLQQKRAKEGAVKKEHSQNSNCDRK